jgi:hypothetical protein
MQTRSVAYVARITSEKRDISKLVKSLSIQTPFVEGVLSSCSKHAQRTRVEDFDGVHWPLAQLLAMRALPQQKASRRYGRVNRLVFRSFEQEDNNKDQGYQYSDGCSSFC